jgi:N-acetyl-alpha-D-muramate 1-phosphate uridylyltransferase
VTLPVAILAGGLATRLRPITETIPKVLVDIGGKPFAEHQLALLRRHGVTRVVFCVGHMGEAVREALGDGHRNGMKIEYSFDGPELQGTGGALRNALPLLGEGFLVTYGDTYLDCDYAAVERAFLQSGKAGLMAVFRNAGKWDRSNVVYSDGRIVNYDKGNRTPDMEHIDYGLGALRAEAFSLYPGDGFLDLETVYRDLLARAELAGFEAMHRFYEIGSPEGLEETRDYLSGKETYR